MSFMLITVLSLSLFPSLHLSVRLHVFPVYLHRLTISLNLVRIDAADELSAAGWRRRLIRFWWRDHPPRTSVGWVVVSAFHAPVLSTCYAVYTYIIHRQRQPSASIVNYTLAHQSSNSTASNSSVFGRWAVIDCRVRCVLWLTDWLTDLLTNWAITACLMACWPTDRRPLSVWRMFCLDWCRWCEWCDISCPH